MRSLLHFAAVGASTSSSRGTLSRSLFFFSLLPLVELLDRGGGGEGKERRSLQNVNEHKYYKQSGGDIVPSCLSLGQHS